MLEMGPTGQEAGVRWEESRGGPSLVLGLSSMKGGPLLTERIAEATVVGTLMGRYQHLELRGEPGSTC